MKDENDVIRSIIDELDSLDIQGDQMEGERMVLLEVSSKNLIPDLRMSKEIKGKVKVVLLEVSLMKFILGISKEIKWRVKVVLLEVSLMRFFLQISKEIKWKVKVVLLEVPFMNFILRISKEIKWKVKVFLLEVSLMNFFGYPRRSNGK